MAQARRRSSKGRRGGSGHGFGMFAAGVVAGAVGASFFIGLRSDDPESIGRGIEHMIESSRQRFQAAEPAQQAAQPRSPVATEYKFYEVLPEIDHIVSEVEEQQRGPEQQPAPKPAHTPERAAALPVVETKSGKAAVAEPQPAPRGARYMLQAGAFNTLEDADRLKARLALAGLESSIQKVTIEGRGDFFRVRLGPYSGAETLRAADGTLKLLGINSLKLKVSDG